MLVVVVVVVVLIVVQSSHQCTCDHINHVCFLGAVFFAASNSCSFL